jgi:hypothetical protein
MSAAEGRTATIELSAKGLERAVSIDENNFAIVSASSELHCTKFQAAFVSPRICELLRSDPTVDRFIFEGIPRESWQPLKSSQFMTELLRKGRICIDELSLGLLHVLFENLGNVN